MKKAISLLAALTLTLGIFIPVNAQSDKAIYLPKQVLNGDAENSTYGWRGLFGNETAVVSNVALDGNRVIKVEPKGAYGSPMFDIGPAVIKDTENGYAGYGTGKYIVSFKFKAENTLSADKYFFPTVCSAVWDKIKIAVTTDSTSTNYAIMKSGSDWTTITATFTVTDEHLAKLKRCMTAETPMHTLCISVLTAAETVHLQAVCSIIISTILP